MKRHIRPAEMAQMLRDLADSESLCTLHSPYTVETLHEAADKTERLYKAVRELQKQIDRMLDSDLEVHKARKERAWAIKKLENCQPPESWLKANGYLDDPI